MKMSTFEFVGTLLTALAVIGIFAAMFMAINNDRHLQEHYNDSIVACMNSNRTASDCHDAMKPSWR